MSPRILVSRLFVGIQSTKPAVNKVAILVPT